MSRAGVLAVLTANGRDERTTEFLRICVGLLAGGHDVALRDLRDCAEPLAERAPARARPWVTALVGEGVLSRDGRVAGADGLRDALRGCRAVLHLAEAVRPGAPPVLVIDDAYLDAVSDEQLRSDLASAGQVVRG